MIPLLLAVALGFPLPSGNSRPVSEVTWGSSPYGQSSPVIASNGSMSLAAWGDGRFADRAGYRGATLATRLDTAGTPLDRLGIVLPAISMPEAALWVDDHFVVIGRSASDRVVVSIATDGSVSAPTRVDVPYEENFAAVSSPEHDARLLFIHYLANEVLTAHITDAAGRVIAEIKTPLHAQLALPPAAPRWMACARNKDFGIFGPNATIRLDREGHVLANNAVTWPFQYFFPEYIAIAGNDDQGFVLLRENEPYLTNVPPSLLACQIDNDARFTGRTALVDVPSISGFAQNRPAIAATGDAYVVANAGFFGDRSTHEYVSRLTFDLVSTPREVPYAGTPVLLQNVSGHLLLVAQQRYVLYMQPLTDEPNAASPVLINQAATVQSQASIVASATSYAVVWQERGPDAFDRTYIRRFLPNGTPIDASPRELDRRAALYGAPAFSTPIVTATADTYIINGRRLSAATGEWLDEQAPPGFVRAAASNGRDALVAIGTATGPVLQQIKASGLRPNAVALPTGADVAQIASNGTDYLVVWNVPFICNQICPPIPTPVYALRVRSDGTWIDPAPAQLAPDGQTVSVAWSGTTYVVSWFEEDGIHATRFTANGFLPDGNRGVVVEPIRAGEYAGAEQLVAFNGDVILFVRHLRGLHDPAFWTAARLHPEDLRSAAQAVRTEFAFTGSLAAISLLGTLHIAYDDNTDPSVGYVPRVYVREFFDPVPRRRATAH
jgi:hypothetical protein